MAAPFHKILSKTDRALYAYILSEGAGTADNTFPAKRSIDKALPNCTVYSERFEADPSNPGKYIVRTNVQIKTSAALNVGEQDNQKARKDGEALQAAVFDLFFKYGTDTDTTPLADRITAAARALAAADAANYADLADFKCDEIHVTGGDLTTDEDSTLWIDSIELMSVVRSSAAVEP